MDDRKFDETMRSYVASTAKGEEHDLAKLKAEEKPKKRRARLSQWLPAVAAVVVVAVTLSVCLPLTLAAEGDDPHYGFGGSFYDVDFISLDDVSQLEEVYGFSMMIPDIAVETQIHATAIVDSEDGTFYGGRLSFLPVDWAFGGVECTAVGEGKQYDWQWDVDTSYARKCDWHGTEVYFTVATYWDESTSGTELIELHRYRIKFTFDGLDYHIEFDFFPIDLEEDGITPPSTPEEEVVLALDMLFSYFGGDAESGDAE